MEEIRMKCLFVDGVKKVSLRECEIAELHDEDVLIRLKARGICGTDLNSYRSGQAMGFGHEMSGIVEKAGKNSKVREGARVFVINLAAMDLVSYAPDAYYSYMGGFAEYIVVRNAEIGRNLFEIPDDMSYAQGALAEPFSVAMSGVRKANINENSKVVIFGAGIIGMLAFEYLKTQNVKNVVIADINEIRLQKAKDAGAIVCNSSKDDLKTFLTNTFGQGFSPLGPVPDVNVYIDAAGVGALVSQAVDMSVYCGEVVIIAGHRKPAEINLSSVMNNNLTIHGSLMFSMTDIADAISLIHENPYIAKEIISHEIPFEEAEKAFAIADDADQSLKVMMVS